MELISLPFLFPRNHWIVTGSVCNFRVVDLLLSVDTRTWARPVFWAVQSEFFSHVGQNSHPVQFLSCFLTNSNWRLPPRIMVNHSPLLTKSGICDCHWRPRMALLEPEVRYKAMQQCNDNTALWIICFVRSIIEFWFTLSWPAALFVCLMSVMSWSLVWK
jgi:hypothetical protein